MAILKIDTDLCDDSTFMSVVNRSFDSIEELAPEKNTIKNGGNLRVFRVTNDEIPKDDKQIAFDIALIDGIEPFVSLYYW